MPNLFPRKLRLVIADDDGAGVDLGKLSCIFQVERIAQGGVAFARVGVFNLSEDTIGKIGKVYTQIRLEGGYPGRIGTIFNGQVRNSYPIKDGADKRLDIFAQEAAADLDNVSVNLDFSNGTTLHDILRTIIDAFSNITVSATSLDFLTNVTIAKEIVSGSAIHQLERLRLAYRFNYQVIGGVFHAIDFGRAPGDAAIKISRETGMIGSPLISTAGIEVRTLLDPRIFPGRRIDVETAAAQLAQSSRSLQSSPDLISRQRARGGLFDVQSLVHVGETRGQVWYTQARATPAVTI